MVPIANLPLKNPDTGIDLKQRQIIRNFLKFWFGTHWNLSTDKMPKDRMKLWFNSDAEQDEMMKKTFAEDFTKLEQGAYDKWQDDHEGRLVTVIFYDQLSRVLFRKNKKAFENDNKALAITKKLLENDAAELRKYHYHEQMFLLLPLEHSESKEDGTSSVANFAKLAEIIK